jgi:ATP-binding cassette subfamily F protein 3
MKPLQGTVEWGAGVRQATLDQETAGLTSGASVLDSLWDLRPSTPELDVRSYLGGFLFRGEEVFRTVQTLSGGERTRLGLARLIWSGPNLIFLDEPTNHLDIASREALEGALQAYDGTLLAISHDRYFLDAIATQILWVDDGEAHLYRGTYSEAREKRSRDLKQAAERAAAPVAAPVPAARRGSAPAAGRGSAPAAGRGSAPAPAAPGPAADLSTKEARARDRAERDRIEREQRKRDRARKKLEEEIAAMERKLAELTAAMEDDSAKGDVAALRRESEEYGRVRAALDALLARWVETGE